MEEQIVQYNEHPQADEENIAVSTAPAPMVERAFRLLDILSGSEDGLILSDLARMLNMSKGSVHGLLKTLESNGAVEQIEDRRYVLGPRLYDITQAYIQRAGLRRFAVPAMRRLAAKSGETVFLGRIEQKGVRIIECIVDEGETASLHITAPRGTRVHMLAAATGPLVLASWPAEQREEYLYTHPLPRFTEHSLLDPQQYLARIEEASHHGVSIDHEEYLAGVNAVAAPIYGASGRLIALLWMVGFSSRFSGTALERAATELRSEAEAISRSLGAV
ncbi:MAG TPA: IclR family transcriptional regulator [Ktedonobacteraceae bacterium]|jgi:IclR family KDG regulon transcriptional repressor|nr:IclR family transcriptional regulator [Ktedonobacteraceae bacterium]